MNSFHDINQHHLYPPEKEPSDFATDDPNAFISTTPPVSPLCHAEIAIPFFLSPAAPDPGPSHKLLLASTSSLAPAAKERGPRPIFCSRGRKVASEAQMQARETSMKLQMLSGTMESVVLLATCSGVVMRHVRDHSHVRSSEMEKSRMYLKRTKVAMQALLTKVIRQQSIETPKNTRDRFERAKAKEYSQRPKRHGNPSSDLRPFINLQPPQNENRHNSHNDIRSSREAAKNIHRDHIRLLASADTLVHTWVPLALHGGTLERRPQDERQGQTRDDGGRRAEGPCYEGGGAAEAQQEECHGEFGTAEGEEVHDLCDEEGAAPEWEVVGWVWEGGDVFAAAVGDLSGDHCGEDGEGGLRVGRIVS